MPYKMAYRQDGYEWGNAPEPETSPASRDPVVNLAACVARQALRDLTGRDPVMALDAFMWFVYGPGRLFLEAIGFDLESEDILVALGGLANEQ